MLSNKTLKIAFLVSITGHSLLLYGMPGFARISPHKKAKDYPRVVYYELKKDLPAKLPIKEKKAQSKTDFSVEKERLTQDKLSVSKVTPEEKARITLQSQEILQKASEEKSLYLGYYQGIREKIRRIVNHNYYNYSKVGEIFISFILGSDGDLKDIEFIGDKSDPDKDLMKIVFNSVKEASPFPSFPKDLNRKHLSFNVLISFEKSD